MQYTNRIMDTADENIEQGSCPENRTLVVVVMNKNYDNSLVFYNLNVLLLIRLEDYHASVS